MSIRDNKIIAIIRLSREAYGEYKLQIIALTVLGFIGGILEGIGVNALIPLFSFFVEGGDQGTDPISKFLKSSFAYFNIDFSLKQILIFICILFIFKAIVILISNYISIKITSTYEERTRNNLLGKTLKADWPYLLKQKLGYLENTIKIDVAQSSALFSQIGAVIMLLTSLIVYVFVAINISFYITIMTLILGGMLFLLLKPLVYKTRSTSREVVGINKEMAHHINENIIGMKTVKAMFATDNIINAGKKYFEKFKKASIRIFLLKSVTDTMLQPISLIFICAVFAFSYKMPGFQFSALIAVVYLIQKIFQYIQQLQKSLHEANERFPYLQSVLNYEKQALKNKEVDRGISGFKFNKQLEFKNVYFSYNSDKKILTDINISIKRGQMVGLIGPSGTGKTTIVDLILRLFYPSKGEILLDNVNISGISLSEWRKKIGYVSQDIFLKNDTIANNIKFYNNITNKDVEEVAKMANIYDFIQKCPQKFNTMIGERGIMLSAGQRQRVIIARVLARKPEFLVLDEATSALDNESELKIQKVIENLKKKVTVLVIAHRLSTIINSDKLYILEKGKIIEEGSPKELLKDKESYFTKVYNLRT